MTPDQIQDARPLLIALFLVGLVIVLTDFVLLARWIAYQIRLQRAIAQFGGVYDVEPSPISWSLDSQPSKDAPVPGTPPELDGFELPVGGAATIQSAATGGNSAPAAAPSPLPYPVLPPPFAKRWSLVHPFLGFQFVLLVANVLALIPLVFIVLFVVVTDKRNALLSLNSPLIQQGNIWAAILGLFLQNALFVVVVVYFLRRYGLTLESIGLSRRPTTREILLGLGLGAGLFLLATGGEALIFSGLQHLLPPGSLEHLKKMGELFDAANLFKQLPSPFLKLLFGVAGAIAAPIGEEVFFRGFVYNVFKKRWNVPVAIVLSGLAFALVHASPLGILVIFPMGMALGYVYERTGSLWVTITIHAVNNGVAFLLTALFPQMGS